MAKEEPVTPVRDWRERENRAIVADYFDMLSKQQRGEPFVKSEHNRRLRESLDGRSRASVEYKYRNISAALHDMGLPFVDGYWPADNYQASLVGIIEDHLREGPFVSELDSSVESTEPRTPLGSIDDYWRRLVEVPQPIVRDASREPVGAQGSIHRFDYAARDDANRRLGRLGEEFALNAERQRLTRASRADLAARVEWSSKERGDGLGYDIRSFEASGRETFIEVKTTNIANAAYPFYLSQHEVRVSEELDARYRLFRVFSFTVDPHFFVMDGAVTRTCLLRPRSYVATPRG